MHPYISIDLDIVFNVTGCVVSSVDLFICFLQQSYSSSTQQCAGAAAEIFQKQPQQSLLAPICSSCSLLPLLCHVVSCRC